MKRELTIGAIFFLVFFCLGLGSYAFLKEYLLEPSEPIAGQDEALLGDGKVSEVAEQVSPSVVGITNLKDDGDMFSQRTKESTGSGVILNHEGYIVTNNHVVKDADRLIVTLADGNEEQATLVGTDPRTDLAVIKVKVDNHVTPVKFGNSDQVVVGEQVIAIGNPLGLRFARSVTAGVVSGLNRLLTTEEGFAFRLIQTDAAINPGNSGGALVNLNGQLIGINTIKIAAEGFEGMGFSIPANRVKAVVNDLIAYGEVRRPAMGVRMLCDFSKNEAGYYNLPVNGGVAVDPIEGGPAAKAGLEKYDIITKIDGKDVQTGIELQEMIFDRKIGQEITVQFLRLPDHEGIKPQVKTVQLKLEK